MPTRLCPLAARVRASRAQALPEARGSGSSYATRRLEKYGVKIG